MMCLQVLFFFGFLGFTNGKQEYEKEDLIALREEVQSMFNHAYSGYLNYAYPYDELRSLTCDGFDTWGSFSLTLIDALDTLAVMGNFSEFRRVAKIISTRENFEANINVSVFETNIRVVGGLLSAHLLSWKAGLELEPGWPCNGPLLRLAADMATRLIAAFDTPTGMPYGTVNLKHGVPEGETSITCTAGIGTFLLEFGTLSRLTGDPLYEEVAMNAIKALHYYKSNIGLVGNHIDVLTGHWTAQDSGIGAGVDSYFEYLAKGSILFQNPLLTEMFHEHKAAIEKYIRKEDWHLWVSMTKGQVTLPVFQSLEAYWPGVLSLFGEISEAMKSLHNYHRVWKQFGFTPEFYNIPQTDAGTNREGYPLRPELIESVMYLYRATADPYLIQVGVDILRSLEHSAKTTCGYATINDVRDHRRADRMESFFLAETTKYLYLLFDPTNFIHNNGQSGDVIETPWGDCIVNAGGYIFNTEAHPIDPGALQCCQHMQNVLSKQLLFKTLTKNPPSQSDENEQKIIQSQNEHIIEIVKLSEIRQSSTSQTQKATTKNVENDHFIPKKANESVKVHNPELNKSTNHLDAVNMKAIAPPTVIYKADDSENMDNVDKDSSSKNTIENNTAPSTTETLQKPIRFDPQTMLESIRKQNLYSTNLTARFNYQSMFCHSQPFLQRMSILGEIF